MELALGNIYYFVNEDFNIFTRKKVNFTDANGVEWFSYTKPSKSFEVRRIEICGLVKKQIFGTIDSFDQEHTKDDWYFRYPDLKDHEPEVFYKSDFPPERLFTSEKDAIKERVRLEEETKVNDRS